MLKVVSIGGFGHSVFVFDEMQDFDGARLVGLAPAFEGEDIHFFTRHALCREVPVFEHYRDMLERLEPDVVVIGTRLDLIPELIVEAAQAGCHIIAEKPLALDLDSLARIRQVVRREGVKLIAMLTMRADPVFLAARKVYQRGGIGEAVIINSRKSYKYGVRPSWFGDRATYGGTIGWIGIHALDVTNFVTGLGFRQVAAMKGNFSHSKLPACEDHCALMMELSNGGHATASLDLFRPDAAETHGDDWIRVVGTKGVLEARGSDQSCTVLSAGGEFERVTLPAKATLFRDFFLGAASGTEMSELQEASLMLTAVSLAARESAETGQFVSLSE